MQNFLTRKEKLIFIIAAGTIVFFVVANILFLPILKRNEALNNEIRLTRSKLVKYLRLLNKKDIFQNKYGELTSGFKIREAGGDTAVGALSELESMAQNANIKIVEIRPLGVSKSSTLLKEFIIDLKTEGNTEGYLKFIYDLESSLSLLTIKKFQLIVKSNSKILEGSFSISQIPITE